MKIQIKNRWTGASQFETDAEKVDDALSEIRSLLSSLEKP